MVEIVTEVPVAKALPLKNGESIREYSQQLSDAARSHMRTSFKSESTNVWMVEIFSTTVVIESYEYDETKKTSKTRYWALPYKREKTGVFAFGRSVEVIRTTHWSEKPSMVAKSQHGFAWEKFWSQL